VTTRDDEAKRLRSVALQNANSILLARQRADQRSEFYLAEGQRLAHMGSWSLDPSGFFDYWSPELFRICGLDPAFGAPKLNEYLAGVHPQDRERMTATIEKMLRERSGCDVKQRILRPDGELRHVRWVGVPASAEGTFKGFVGTAMDVTEQELLTQELRRREADLAEAQRLSHTGSFGWRVDTGEILWSEETFRIFQYERTTKPTVELVIQRVHPEDAGLVTRTVERASQDGQDFDFEYRLLLPDGSITYVHVVAHAISNGSDGIEYVGAVMDVTEQHQARAALEKALDQIKRSQDRLKLVIDTIPSMVWRALPDGSIDFVSQSWESYYGLSLEDIDRLGWDVVIHPEDVAQARDTARTAMAAGEPFEHELRSRRADGQYRWFLHRAVPLRDELGSIVKWLGTSTDIDDRKRAEMLLAGEKRLLEMMARGDSRAPVLDAFCRLFEELSSGSLSSILLLDPGSNQLRHGAAPSLPRNYTEAIDGSVIGPSAGSCGTAAYRAKPVIVSHIATDPLWADYRDLALAHGLQACWSSPIMSASGAVLGTFATYYREPRSPTQQELDVIEQITHLASLAVERKQSEDALREQAALLNLTRDTIFVRDLNDVITFWNRGAEELYGWKKEEAIGSVAHELMQTSFPVPLEGIRAELIRAGRWEGELVHTRRDGAKVAVASRWSLQRDDQGRPSATLETNNDITARKQVEVENERLEAQLRQSQKMEAMGTLAGGIAHDFNNILGAILGYGELAQRNLADASAMKRYLGQVMHAGGRGKALVERILAFSRSGIGERVPVHVQSVVEETLDLLAASLTPQVRLEKRLEAGDAAVVGDATQLHQVVMNLCTNAMQAMDRGGVLAVAMERIEMPGRRLLTHGTLAASPYVRLTVNDTGPGIPSAVLERMFDPFFTTKGVGEGTGLGLSLVHAIVADLGGAIDVATKVGEGTTFAIWLPVVGDTGKPVAETTRELPRGNGEAIMIVDDERVLVNLAEETLAELGYEPAGFDSSVVALQAFRADPQRFALVLTDETMPELTGTELAREIRRLRPEIPIVLMSGYSGSRLTERARAVGVTEVLRKPLVSGDIAEPLARALNAGR
jgi:PAS domain S-box-containing protein